MEKIRLFLSNIRLIIRRLSITRCHMLEVVDKARSYTSIIKGKMPNIRIYFQQNDFLKLIACLLVYLPVLQSCVFHWWCSGRIDVRVLGYFSSVLKKTTTSLIIGGFTVWVQNIEHLEYKANNVTTTFSSKIHVFSFVRYGLVTTLTSQTPFTSLFSVDETFDCLDWWQSNRQNLPRSPPYKVEGMCEEDKHYK
jgi:hypothetical protein